MFLINNATKIQLYLITSKFYSKKLSNTLKKEGDRQRFCFEFKRIVFNDVGDPAESPTSFNPLKMSVNHKPAGFLLASIPNNAL